MAKKIKEKKPVVETREFNSNEEGAEESETSK
jgi:hypothetical protein